MAHAGEILNQSFRLDAWLGAGGSSEVWRATHIVTGRQVVIKLGTARDERARMLVWREAEISRNLRHKNVVRTLTGDATPDGRAYLVYEFIDGLPLADILRKAAPFTPSQTVATLRPLLNALGAIHARSVVHRDIKPSNILISPDRGPVLLDFGAAGILSAGGQTVVGEVAGSLLYMSPEQISGTAQGPTADLYGLALVGLEMDTGHPPPGGIQLV